MYWEIAHWWPLLSRPEEYVEEAEFFTRTLNRGLRRTSPDDSRARIRRWEGFVPSLLPFDHSDLREEMFVIVGKKAARGER
jgi:hypothetical protein